jgi:hypothetical protein
LIIAVKIPSTASAGMLEVNWITRSTKRFRERSATPPFEPVGLGGSPDRLHFGQPQE